MAAVVPLESNPGVFTGLMQRLGGSPLLSFHDLYSVSEPELLAFLPRPASAVVLLFPVSEAYEQLRQAESTQIPSPDGPFWLKQQVKNACGLYALLHILLNLPAGLVVAGSPVDKLRAELLRPNADPVRLVTELSNSLYDEYSQQGQTEAPAATDDVNLHFVAFVKTASGVFELDGRREGPVLLSANGGNNSESDVVDEQAVKDRLVQYFTLADSDNALKFAMMALAPSFDY
ncbi:ubiquitin-specific protease [Martiniozyma asiatica (nom. inval.)]|nr:ubiquitin-specific protease [Martiniozyma asiatica]